MWLLWLRWQRQGREGGSGVELEEEEKEEEEKGGEEMLGYIVGRLGVSKKEENDENVKGIVEERRRNCKRRISL